MLTFSETFSKAKNKLLALSGICLFIGMTEALPQKISVLGLDLSAKPYVAGWFILAITGYFFLILLVLSALDLIKYYLPFHITSKSSTLTGDFIGLSEDECLPHQELHPEQVGTPFSELGDIQRKKAALSDMYSSKYTHIHNFVTISFDMIFPFIFCLIAAFVLSRFLWLKPL